MPLSGFPASLLLLLRYVPGASADSPPRVFQSKGYLPPVNACPENCEALFTKLEVADNSEGLGTQHVEMQARGEPQSGLGFMFSWASETLGQSCMYLQRAYGRESCRVEWTDHRRKLIFEPWRVASVDDETLCLCDTIEAVTIEISNEDKHLLPCDPACAWAHTGSSPRPHEQVCVSVDGLPLENHAGLLRCMDEAACPITDDRLQMAVLRDPRGTATSLFFHMERHHPEWLEKAGLSTVDGFFLAVLPTMCKWTSVRYRLFAEVLAARSAVYWHDETREAPLRWQYNIVYYLGLSLPAAVVEWTAHIAASKPLGSGLFATPEADGHPFEESALATNGTFEDHVSAESVSAANDILRVWLPPVLHEKLGVPEAR